MMHFVRTFLIMRAVEEVRNYRKFECIKNIFENVRWENAYTPHPNLLDPPLAISCKNHHKNQVYFSHLAPLVTDCFFY